MKKSIDTDPYNTVKGLKPEIENKTETTPAKAMFLNKKIRRRIMIPVVVTLILAAAVICFRNDLAYAFAEWRFNCSDYTLAKGIFESLGDFNDSPEYLTKIYYNDACNDMETGEYQKAIDIFSSRSGYADSAALINKCYMLMADDFLASGDYENAAECYVKAANEAEIKKTYISWGAALYTEKDFTGAMAKWQPYAGDEDVDAKIAHAEYELAYIASASGQDYAAVVKLNDLNFDERAHKAVAALLCMNPEDTATLTLSDNHIVYISSDGTVYADGSNSHGQCGVDGWTGIVSLCASELNTYGLRYDGTVLAAGSNAFRQCDISHWENIIAICSSDNAVFGLKKNGKVMFSGGEAGQYDDVSTWTGIVKISAGKDHVAAVDCNGRVYSAGKNEYGQCDAAGAENIASAICAPYRTILIHNDGLVSIYGVTSDELKGFISNWKDIISVSSSYSHIVAQDSLGRVFAAGENRAGQCNVYDWSDVAYFFARSNLTGAVTNEGSLLMSVTGHTLDWKVLIWK